MIGTPPNNMTFQIDKPETKFKIDFMSSKRIPPSISVQPRVYNEAGYIPHPLQFFGRVGGIGVFDRTPVAGTTGNTVGSPAWSAAHTHGITG